MQRITLTGKEAAQLIGVSYWLILEMAKKHEIPHFRMGNRVLFREDSLLQWLKEKEKTSTYKLETNQQYGKLRRIEV
ncbi:excisionase family DNA-binding protein [Aneurinibacillus danicus]|uniref:Helix-turn-helix domain-containing protein n=1 Tax=Aneurinibacillus danicus TaxID=267746 RepID=A0A511VCN5_9BACL|nr:excisionase family DNA-binding protein [Aneurinibacillus danicus]GEN36624.1 helix-turn-helix domain-containing protein [Aneurinibacillus danicus]